MKLLAILILSLICACSCYAAEPPERYTESIKSVEFFPNGARFFFSVEPKNGNFRAVIPGSFNQNSVRLENSESVKGSITVRSYPRLSWIPENLTELKTQVDELDRKISELQAKEASLTQTINFIEQLKPEKSNPEQLLNYIKETQALKLETENSLLSLKEEAFNLEQKRRVIAQELNSKLPKSNTSYIEITGKADKSVMLSAFTTAATWSPRYILDLDTESGDVGVKMFVRVSEKTGLDYHGSMTMHTKTPDENITTPSLSPLKVGIKPKVQTVGGVGGVRLKKSNSMYESARMAMKVEEDGMAMDTYTADEEDFEIEAPSVTSSISDRIVNIAGTVTGDGTEKEFEVYGGNFALKGKMLLEMIPEIRNNAWIIASMDESNDKLIPGEAELRVDKHTSGKIYIGEYGESQKKIPFGYAEQITVKKEALIGKTGVSWFSGVSTNGYKLEITNGTYSEKVITVRDRLPVPTDDKIKLDVKRIEPKENERDRENRLTWVITVPASATASIIVDYTLSYPSGEELEYK